MSNTFGGPPIPSGGQIITPQRAQMAHVDAVSKDDLNSRRLQFAATLDECRAKIVREVATLSAVHGTIQTSAKVLEGAMMRGGIDWDVIAGSDDLPALREVIEAGIDIAERCGSESATILGTRKGS